MTPDTPSRPDEVRAQATTMVDVERRLGIVQFSFGYLALSSRGCDELAALLSELADDVRRVGG